MICPVKISPEWIKITSELGEVINKTNLDKEKVASKIVDKGFSQPTFNHVPKITYKNPNISFKMPYHVKK